MHRAASGETKVKAVDGDTRMEFHEEPDKSRQTQSRGTRLRVITRVKSNLKIHRLHWSLSRFITDGVRVNERKSISHCWIVPEALSLIVLSPFGMESVPNVMVR